MTFDKKAERWKFSQRLSLSLSLATGQWFLGILSADILLHEGFPSDASNLVLTDLTRITCTPFPV